MTPWRTCISHRNASTASSDHVEPLAPAAALLVGVVVFTTKLGARLARAAGLAGFEPVVGDQVAPALMLAVRAAAQLRYARRFQRHRGVEPAEFLVRWDGQVVQRQV